MIHVAHTMATPDLELPEALRLFADLGFQASEVISIPRARQGQRWGPAAGEARVFSYEWESGEIDAVSSLARTLGVPFLTITQYAKELNHPDGAARSQVLTEIAQQIELAHRTGARFVRLYGGMDSFGADSWPYAVESLRRLADHAERARVILLVENHPGTLTVTGTQTARLVRETGCRAVRALYDPANVLYHSSESWEETWHMQEDLVAYVHVKDYQLEDSGGRRSCPVGDGVVPWKQILPRLRARGAPLPLSQEYEKKWSPQQLPDARTGLSRSLRYVRQVLAAT